MKTLLLSALLICPGFFGFVGGQTQQTAKDRFHTHDGFFLRLLGGIGSGNVVVTDIPLLFPFMGFEDKVLTLSGKTFTYRIQIGTAVAKNLILFGEIGASSLDDPDVDGINASIRDYGAGLCYYFMPLNFYFSGSITISHAAIEVKEVWYSATPRPGAGFFISAGKEWWAAADLGLGIAGFMYVSHMTDIDKYYDQVLPVKNTVFGLVFSATYQ